MVTVYNPKRMDRKRKNMKLSNAPLSLRFRFVNCKRQYKLVGVDDYSQKVAEAGTLNLSLYKILDEELNTLLVEDKEIVPISIKASELSPGDIFSHSVLANQYPGCVMSKLTVLDKGCHFIFYKNPHTQVIEYIDGETEVQIDSDFNDVPF